jgi:hypothetical protein
MFAVALKRFGFFQIARVEAVEALRGLLPGVVAGVDVSVSDLNRFGGLVVI